MVVQRFSGCLKSDKKHQKWPFKMTVKVHVRAIFVAKDPENRCTESLVCVCGCLKLLKLGAVEGSP